MMNYKDVIFSTSISINTKPLTNHVNLFIYIFMEISYKSFFIRCLKCLICAPAVILFVNNLGTIVSDSCVHYADKHFGSNTDGRAWRLASDILSIIFCRNIAYKIANITTQHNYSEGRNQLYGKELLSE